MFVIAQSAFDVTSLVPFAIFGVIAIAVWWILERVSSDKSRAEQRLDDLSNPGRRNSITADSGTMKKSDAMTKMLEKASPALAKPLLPKSEKQASSLKARLSHANFRSEAAPTIFLGMKLVSAVIGFVMGGGWSLYEYGFQLEAAMYTLVIGGISFYVLDIGVWLIARSRKEKIFLALPDALDLIARALRSGPSLAAAFDLVGQEVAEPLGTEFMRVFEQQNLGIPLNEAMDDLTERVPNLDL